MVTHFESKKVLPRMVRYILTRGISWGLSLAFIASRQPSTQRLTKLFGFWLSSAARSITRSFRSLRRTSVTRRILVSLDMMPGYQSRTCLQEENVHYVQLIITLSSCLEINCLIEFAWGSADKIASRNANSDRYGKRRWR